MRGPRARQSWLILLLTAAALRGGEPRPDALPQKIAVLLRQLGDDSFARREAAGRGLQAVGEPALPALRDLVETTKDLEAARRGRQAIRAIILAARKSKTLGLEMVLIEAGEFQMGSPRNEANRRPEEQPHRVRITRPFLLGAHEVTQQEYEQLVKTNPSWFAGTGLGKDRVIDKDTRRFPVEHVTWYEAIEFCNRLSEADGYPPYYRLADVQRAAGAIQSAQVFIAGGNGYRLPTEAEWEYACRAGTTTPFHYGVNSTGREANTKSGAATGYGAPPSWPSIGRTTKVGSYAANFWGLHDMHGNAAEWCWDWYDKDYYPAAPVDDPHGPERGTQRVLRGGSWLLNDSSCRSASRFSHAPDTRNYYGGFRVARTP